MKISIDVYTKDIDAALDAFRVASASGRELCLTSNHDYNDGTFENYNFRVEVDHLQATELLEMLDNGQYSADVNDL